MHFAGQVSPYSLNFSILGFLQNDEELFQKVKEKVLVKKGYFDQFES